MNYKKAIGYVRLSDRDTERATNDLQKQKDLILNWIKMEELKNDTKIDLEIIEDISVSGKKVNRKGLLNLIGRLKTEKIDYCIVMDLSRLCRNTEFNANFLDKIIVKHKINFISIYENIDTSTPAGRFMFRMFGCINEFYSELTSEKIRNSIKRKRENGLAVGGTTPFGFSRQSGRLVENELKTAIDLIVNLKTSGKSFNEIRKVLNNEKVKTSNGGQWQTSTIRGIYLRNRG